MKHLVRLISLHCCLGCLRSGGFHQWTRTLWNSLSHLCLHRKLGWSHWRPSPRWWTSRSQHPQAGQRRGCSECWILPVHVPTIYLPWCLDSLELFSSPAHSLAVGFSSSNGLFGCESVRVLSLTHQRSNNEPLLLNVWQVSKSLW